MKTGRKFENDLSLKLQNINKKENGFFIKSPTPVKMLRQGDIFVPVYANKALCDFIGIYNKKFVIIEAKYISGVRFDFERLKKHQEKQLASIKRNGGIAIIIFGYKNKLIFLEIDKYLVYKLQSNKKSINIDSLIEIGEEINLSELEEYIDRLTK